MILGPVAQGVGTRADTWFRRYNDAPESESLIIEADRRDESNLRSRAGARSCARAPAQDSQNPDRVGRASIAPERTRRGRAPRGRGGRKTRPARAGRIDPPRESSGGGGAPRAARPERRIRRSRNDS